MNSTEIAKLAHAIEDLMNYHELTMEQQDLYVKFNQILKLTTVGQLNIQEMSKLLEQIIEHKVVVPCIRSLPPTSGGYNPWHEAAKPKLT